MAQRIIEGRLQNANIGLEGDRAPDFCIIGSGAGGGVCALKLAQAGFDVVLLEEGPHIPKGQGHGGKCHVRPTFLERESTMIPRLYQEGGGRITTDGGVLVQQGRCLGGGTSVNWSACLPPPQATLQFWKEHFGLPFDGDSLLPYMEEVVGYLNIHANDKLNSAARLLRDGCTKLGWDWAVLPNNTVHCRECGSCGTGCAYDRKQSGIVTWLADAVENPGAQGRPITIYTDAKVYLMDRDKGKIRGVHARFQGHTSQDTRFRLSVWPKLGVILSAGSVGTPSILLRSGINPNRQVGKHTHIHPVTICYGRYPEATHAAYGVPDNMMSREFAAGPTGYLIETGSFSPVLISLLTLDFGEDLRRTVRDYFPRGAALYAHNNSGFDLKQPYGRVKLDGNDDPELEYKLAPDNQSAMRESLKNMTRIHLKAGAESVYHFTNPSIEIRSESELNKLDQVSFEPSKTTVVTVHVMGGCRMSDGRLKSVVDPHFRLRGVSNAWVVDGSVFPTGLGANPQVTIYSLALRAAHLILKHFDREDRFTLPHQQKGKEAWPWTQ